MKLCGETFSDTLSSKSSYLAWLFSLFQEQWQRTTGLDVTNLMIPIRFVLNGIHTILILSTYCKNSKTFGKKEIFNQKTINKIFWSNIHVILQRLRVINALMPGSRFRKTSIHQTKTHFVLIPTRCSITLLCSKCLYSSRSSTWLMQERLVMVSSMFSQASSTTRCSLLSFS